MKHSSRTKPLAGLVWLVLLACIGTTAKADTQRVEVGPAQVGLLELYTSEGCSSCPPADRYFSTLVESPDVFQRFVPVAFHVDYWNYLGWRDRFSDAAFSARQRGHVRAGRGRTVYTPGFFYNGDEWRQFFGGDLMAFPPPAAGGVLAVTQYGDRLSVEFEPVGEHAGPLTVSVARLGFGLETAVHAGENRGRNLTHDFVVLALDERRLMRAADAFVAEARLLHTDTNGSRQAVAVWISDGTGGLPLQAAGWWLD